jgi:hypothetical protein
MISVDRTIWKPLFWSMAVAAVWCLSMLHAEQVGMREQAAKDHCQPVAASPNR